MLTTPKLVPATHVKRYAFMGPMCSGKTYCADYLVGNYGFIKMGFAHKLKAIAYDLYGITGKDGDSRRLLQELADDLKKYDKNLLITHLLFNAQQYDDRSIVVDDLRFKPEAIALRNNGFKIIRVTCEDSLRQERISRLYPTVPQSAQEHRSEQEWASIPADYSVVSNNINAIFDLTDMLGLE